MKTHMTFNDTKLSLSFDIVQPIECIRFYISAHAPCINAWKQSCMHGTLVYSVWMHPCTHPCTPIHYAIFAPIRQHTQHYACISNVYIHSYTI